MDTPFGTSSVWTDDNGVLPVWDLLLDVCRQDRFREQVVDWDVKETLDLRSVKVESDDMVGSGNSQEVRNEP